MLNSQLKPATKDRVLRSLALRTQTAGADAFVQAPDQKDNGDEAEYADKSGTHTKTVRVRLTKFDHRARKKVERPIGFRGLAARV